MYPVLRWSEFRPDMHQAFIVNGHYTKYELAFSYSCVSYHKNTQQLWQKGTSTLFWHRAKVYFICIKLWWLITVPIVNKMHWFIADISLQTYTIYKIMDINATFWHRAKVYLTSIKSLLGLIIVPNITKSTHSFLRYWNKHKM